MTLTKIISGGQTGADQGALFAAEDLGLVTGGWMPNGHRTESGPRPDLAQRFKLFQTSSRDYSVRTYNNVLGSDGTLLFGHMSSRGCRLTKKFILDLNKPYYTVTWPHPRSVRDYQYHFLQWLDHYQIKTLNVAGNREERNPGIFFAVRTFLVLALGAHP